MDLLNGTFVMPVGVTFITLDFFEEHIKCYLMSLS